VSVAIHVCEHSWIVNGNEGHLDKVGEWVIVTELREVLAVIDKPIVSYSIWIGYENVPMDWFSASGSSKDIRLFILDGKADKGEGSETFVGGEMACMKREEVKGICIRADPWFPRVERSLSCSFFFWCNWDNIR
jgi:hypothetical protein